MITAKLGYNDHGCNELTAITNEIFGIVWLLCLVNARMINKSRDFDNHWVNLKLS
jgi:hypothetical protein